MNCLFTARLPACHNSLEGGGTERIRVAGESLKNTSMFLKGFIPVSRPGAACLCPYSCLSCSRFDSSSPVDLGVMFLAV